MDSEARKEIEEHIARTKKKVKILNRLAEIEERLRYDNELDCDILSLSQEWADTLREAIGIISSADVG